MLRIDIQTPFYDYNMFKSQIADILLGQDSLCQFDVNQDGTEVTVAEYSPYIEANLTINGTGFTVSGDGLSLTGGHVSGFGYHEPGATGANADIRHVNLDATALQGLIEGATSVAQLQDDLFDNQPQMIIGSPSGDYIQGGHAADIIHGGGGGDFIFASEGNDTIYGGGDKDILNYSLLTNDGGVTVDLRMHTASIGNFMQKIFGFGLISLTPNADTATGNAAGNIFAGDAGNDTISGKGGNDSIDGQDGNDVLAGNGGNDTILGGEGNDLIHGGAGNDCIQGDLDAFPSLIGNDTIYGGAGSDAIHGDFRP